MKPPAAVSAATSRGGTGWGVAAAWALALIGCAGPVGPRGAIPASVTVENHSGYAWRVEFSQDGSASSASAASATLGARETRRIDLPPGIYRVRSTAEGADAARQLAATSAAEREVELRAGRAYVWPLGTLLSVEPPGP